MRLKKERNIMFCTKCGSEIKEGSKFCTHCGQPIGAKTAESKAEALEKPAEKENLHPVIEKSKENASTGNEKVITVVAIAGLIVIAGGAGFFCWNLKNKTSDEATYHSGVDNLSVAQEMETDTQEVEPEDKENDLEKVVEDTKNTSDTTTQNSGEIVLYQADGYEESSGEEPQSDLNQEETNGEYILEGSDSRYISKSELQGFDAKKCRYARNELYARHGRKFQDEEIQRYFDGCSWYEGKIEPDDFQESMLNEYEVANRDLIVDYEKEMGYR